MLPKGDLVIIGICVGLALGIFIAVLFFFFIRWYIKRPRLQPSTNERGSTTLPIRVHGLNTSVDFSASITNSVATKLPEFTSKTPQTSWWSNRSKDRFSSPSGILKYAYKSKPVEEYYLDISITLLLIIQCVDPFGVYAAMPDTFFTIMPIRDIQKGTQNFTTMLGEGSFGPVYKAAMATGEIVAVKVLAADSKQGEREFQTEVSLLGRLHHRNLVNLVGYCVDKNNHMLVYEFMSNGSLANILYGAEKVLSWDERIQVALDISHGIEYLHEGAVPPVIHRDLKSENILLDHSMRAKVADFGLSKEDIYDGRNSGLKGTYGYIDPEYITTNKFTAKSDVYSFGVIIFELITAIHPHQNMMEYVNLAAMSSDGIDEILDKNIVGKCNIEEVRHLANIGHRCLRRVPRKRPSIGEVTQAILQIKQMRRLGREDTMSASFGGRDLSRTVTRIGDQHVELSRMASVKENE
ncbi:hypothetical protein ACFE04_007501 [Oxalis oulophora]